MRSDATRPLRLLLAIPTFGIGGAERVFLTLARSFDRTRFHVILVVFDARDAVLLEQLPPDVEVHVLGATKVRYGLTRFVKLLYRLKPDIVLSTLNHLNSALALTRPLWPRHVRFGVRPTLGISTDFQHHSRSTVLHTVQRSALGLADLAVLQSESMARDFQKHVRMRPAKCTVIPNPVDIAEIGRRALIGNEDDRPATNNFRLVAAGRLHEQKGFDLLLEALALLRSEPVELSILGEGPARNDLERQVERLGLKRQVSMPGYTPNPFPVFRQSDLFVLTSRYEGFPNVVLEALACGVPVLASAIPDLDRFLKTVPGCDVLASLDPVEIATAIRRSMSRGRQRVLREALDEFDVTKVVRRYEEAIERTAGRTCVQEYNAATRQCAADGSA